MASRISPNETWTLHEENQLASITSESSVCVTNLHPRRPGETFAGYRLGRLLGRGAMGVVYEAEQVSLGRRVALKMISLTYAADPEFTARFHREATLQAAMDSPHIVRVFDHGEIDEVMYVSTQFVAGGDLGNRLASVGRLSVPDALQLTDQIAEALGESHGRGVLHRDVKPSNVLLRQGPEVYAYLCDFGIARSADSDLTSAGDVMGTYGYLAPERCQGEPATPATDQYALGCLLVAALTGHAPYTGSEFDIMRQHIEAEVPHLDESSPRPGRECRPGADHGERSFDAVRHDRRSACRPGAGQGPGPL